MSDSNQNEDEAQIDLIELLLKRQAELNALLEVTRAINSNVPSNTLVEMLEMILKNNIKIGRFRLLLNNLGEYYCVSNYGGELETYEELKNIAEELIPLNIPVPLSEHPDPNINIYEYYIPVNHKDESLAFVLVGDFEKGEQLIDNKIDYIQTLINVIVVAFENKKLFKERLYRESIQKEVELAVKVQKLLIPQNLPKNNFLDLEATYLPNQNIGGDFFDFIQINDEEYLWCIADVSGKGISAALIMANFQASLRAFVHLNLELPALVEKLNKVVFNNTNGERFITLFIGVYNQNKKSIKYVNAGHNASLLVKDGCIYPLKVGTTMIGVFDELPFIKQGEEKISCNSIIFNYTDGIVEYDGDEDKSMSESNLEDILLEHKEKSLVNLHQAIIEKAEQLRRYQTATDDITLLSIKFI